MTAALPSPLTHLVGRENDLAALTQLVTTRRLVTLVGTGGSGKTLLAQHIAAHVETEFVDGICMLEFASLSDPAQMLSFVASTLDIHEQPGQSLLQAIIHAFRSKHVLLVFDNCEHLIASCTHITHSLLQHCPRLHVLATSREALRLRGEVLWHVKPLSLPPLTSASSLEQIIGYDAVQLFCERALVACPTFHSTPENISTIVHICRRLDGLPLALELAATRLSTLSMEQLAARLDEGFQILVDMHRAAIRHRTLQAAFDWSYALLSPDEQNVLQRLAVFSGSWTLEAAEAICANDPDGSNDRQKILAILTLLLHTSWIVPQENKEEKVVRYRLLETIQKYAYQHLLTGTDVQSLYAQHWGWYLRFIEAATHHLYGAEQAQWLHRVECEIDNLRLASERSLEKEQSEVAARIAIALGPFWVRSSRLSEGRAWYDTLLAISDLSVPLRLLLLHHTAEILRFQGEYTRMRSLLKERITLLKALNEPTALATACCSLGWAAFYQGDTDDAVTYCTEGLLLFRAVEDQSGIARCISGLALVAMLQQEYPQARTLLQEVVSIRRLLPDSAELVFALNALARVAALQGEKQLAYEACQEALQLISSLKQPFSIIYSLEAMATLTGACNRLVEAVQLFGAAHALRMKIGIPVPPSLRALREHELLPLRTRLDEATFEDHWARGQSFSLDQAYIKALAVIEQLQTILVTAPDLSAGLSQRELEVLRLVGSGLTDAQVAKELVLSTRTVSTHLRSIYRKAAVPSRSAAIRFAVEHHLL